MIRECLTDSIQGPLYNPEHKRQIEFWVPGKPQGKGRPRMTKIGRPYTPKKTREYEAQIRNCCDEQCQTKKAGFMGPVEVEVKAYFPIPKNTTKKNRLQMVIGKLLPSKKPDADNIGKSILDAINGVAYADDKQVVDLVVRKRYTTKDKPGVHVVVKYWPFPDED